MPTIEQYIEDGDKIIAELYDLEEFLKQIEVDHPIEERQEEQELEFYIPSEPIVGYASAKKKEIIATGGKS